MANFKDTLKHALLTYPTIFPNPADVLVHLFCVNGNGYEWVRGELIDGAEYDAASLKMTMEKPFKDSLKDKARMHQRKFIAKHIDEIVNGNPTTIYFGNDPTSSYFLEDITVEYADGLQFPDDITQDWGEALYTFLRYWLYRLNARYGMVDSRIPEAIRKAIKAIKAARERLHPLIYNGQSYAQYAKNMNELVTRVLKDRKRID